MFVIPVLQHAASQQCLSKAFNTLFLSEKEKLNRKERKNNQVTIALVLEKEKIFNTKAMVTCKRFAAVVKQLKNYEHLALSKTKKQTQFASGLC